MPDVIHPVERAMIDARLDAGFFTVIPPGARSGILWDEDGLPLRARIRRASTAGKAAAMNARRREMMLSRRERIERWHAEGESIDRMAERLAVSPRTVENDLWALRKAGRIG